MLLKICYYFLILETTKISLASTVNSKFLGNDLTPEDRHFGRRRRPFGANQGPCNFGNNGKPKNADGTGRTFFDFQYFNVEHNYHVNIDCGGSHPSNVGGNENGGHKPILGGLGNHQSGGHRPIFGSHNKPGGGGGIFGGHGQGNEQGHGQNGGLFGNKPGLGGLFGNKPFQQGENTESSQTPGVFSGAFAGLFPSPQQFATGLSEGIQSFIGTIPQIGQSFQSLLPSFENFQLPQFSGPSQFLPPSQGINSGVSNVFNRPPPITSGATTFPPVAATTPSTATTTDPDDIIYSDQIKPVHEDYDPVSDTYNNKLPPGTNRNQYQSRASQGNRDWQNTYAYDYNRNQGNFYFRGRPEGRSLRFPSK